MKELRSNSTMNNRAWNARKYDINTPSDDSEGVKLMTNREKFDSFRVISNGRKAVQPTRSTCGYSWFNHSVIAIFLTLLISNCANPIPPAGGDRDETPPRLVLEETTPNLQTNFAKQTIELTFDEWIVLKDKTKNILVSPPLEKGNLDVEIKKRTVVVKFPEDEQLKEDATYVINFGEAVQDLTENNPAEDLRFIFATGDVIDSLEVKGQVVDAFTGEPVEETIVMIYRNLADSVVYTQRPFYFSKTDEKGQFTIGNIKAGTYKIAATQDDLIADYQFSNGEQVAFLPETIEVNDSITQQINLRLYEPAKLLAIQKPLDRGYGKLGIQFNQPPDFDSLNLSYSIENLTTFTEIEKDTLRVWYDLTDSMRWETYVTYPDFQIDTVAVRAHSRTEFLSERSFQPTTRIGKAPKSLNPTKPIRFAFNHPVLNIDTSFILLVEDSIQNIAANYSLDTSAAQREIVIDYDWQDSSLYQLTFYPNALTDVYDFNNDTITQSYQALAATDFGTIDFNLTELDSTQQYVLRLFFKKTNLIDTYLINDTTEWQQSISSLPVGEYSIELILDENRNGKWDVGNYDLQQLPEIVKFKTLEELRANWNLDVTFTPAEL